MSELRGRGNDRPDPEQPPAPRPDHPEPESEPLTDLAERYPPEVRRLLAADDTIARQQYTGNPSEPDPDRATPAQPAEAVQETRQPHPQLPPKLREQMTNDPVFTRDGWGLPDPEQQEMDGHEHSAERRTAPDDGSRHPPSATPPDETATDDTGGVVDEQAEAESAGGRSDEVGEDFTPEPDRVAESADTPDHEFIEDADPEDMAAYRRIRETDDVDAVTEHSGFPREVVAVAKDNLFVRQHDVAVGPGDVRHGYFTPLFGVGPLWDRAASGAELTDKQWTQLRSLVAHEYVEAKLMEAGLPYLSSDADAWDEDGMSKVGPEHPSAHNTAPRSLQAQRVDLLAHWDKLKLSRGDLEVAEDLSNLDEVVRLAKEGLGL